MENITQIMSSINRFDFFLSRTGNVYLRHAVRYAFYKCGIEILPLPEAIIKIYDYSPKTMFLSKNGNVYILYARYDPNRRPVDSQYLFHCTKLRCIVDIFPFGKDIHFLDSKMDIFVYRSVSGVLLGIPIIIPCNHPYIDDEPELINHIEHDTILELLMISSIFDKHTFDSILDGNLTVKDVDFAKITHIK